MKKNLPFYSPDDYYCYAYFSVPGIWGILALMKIFLLFRAKHETVSHPLFGLVWDNTKEIERDNCNNPK